MSKQSQSMYLAELTRATTKSKQERFNELSEFSDTKILNLCIRNKIDVNRECINIAKKANIWEKDIKPFVISKIIESEYK